MNRRLQFFVLLLEMTTVLLAAYFEPTHGVRGRLHGEASFNSRPTSYWRMEIDRWIDHHGSTKDALSMMPVVTAESARGEGPPDGVMEIHRGGLEFLRTPTLWERFKRQIGIEREAMFVIIDPEILTHPVGGEDVLRELAREERFREIAERALGNARVLRTAHEVKR